MNRTALTAFLLMAAANSLHAQNATFETLPLTSSPAYVILGVDPENIQRPGSPSEFIAGAQSALVNGRFQPNFAMETTPYYWGKRRGDTSKFEPLNFLLNSSWGATVLRSITFAAATSPSDTATFGGLQPGTGLGFGVHLQLFQGRITRKSFRYLSAMVRSTHIAVVLELLQEPLELNRSIPDVKRFLTENISSKPDEVYAAGVRFADPVTVALALLGKNSLTPADLPFVTSLIERQNTVIDAASHAFHHIRLPLTRDGFSLELAAATGTIAGDSRWDRINHAKTAVWLTPSYRFNTSHDSTVIDFIDLMAVARFTVNAPGVDAGNYLDAGLKGQWIHNRFSLAGEAVYRYATALPEHARLRYTYRADVSIGYKVNDNISFRATFGTNFDGTAVTYSDPKKMFAAGGFNFGFGNLFR